MNSLFSRWRLRWALLRKSFRYSDDLISILYRTYLNHDKVIHYRNGYPVYSLMTPALFSAPAANFISRVLFRSIQNRNLPNLMSFAVNDVCNAKCEHCSFFTAVEEKGRQPLELKQAQAAIQDAQDLGVSVINFVGGEPLMRRDLPAIISSVDKTRATTVLFTNGWALSDRLQELKQSGLDSIFVSIDYSTAEKHDQFRGLPGLFARAIEGIQQAKKMGFSVGFSVTIDRAGWQSGELQRLVALAKETGVHEVLVFEAMPSGRYQDRVDLIKERGWTTEMIESAKPFNNDKNFPGVVFISHLTSHRSVGCSCGTSYFYLSPYGDIMSCDFNHAKFGNILEQPLWKIWEHLSTRKEFCQAKWGGCKVFDSDCRELPSVECGRDGAGESLPVHTFDLKKPVPWDASTNE